VDTATQARLEGSADPDGGIGSRTGASTTNRLPPKPLPSASHGLGASLSLLAGLTGNSATIWFRALDEYIFVLHSSVLGYHATWSLLLNPPETSSYAKLRCVAHDLSQSARHTASLVRPLSGSGIVRAGTPIGASLQLPPYVSSMFVSYGVPSSAASIDKRKIILQVSPDEFVT
jgi:hypothetical protein